MKKNIPLWVKCPIAVLQREFGHLPLRIVWGNVYSSYMQYSNCSASAKDKANIKSQTAVCRYLSGKYGDRISEICTSDVQGEPTPNAPIWVFWWQGLSEAPYIIQTCIRNIRKNAGEHLVHIVDQKTYKDHVQIPEHIEQRLQNGEISLAHFSDYLRMKLLAEHGGLWTDATVFVKKPIDEAVFRMPIWTVRNPNGDTSNISGWEWSINLLGGWKANGLFRAMVDVMEQYWAEHRMVATYFMTDCMIRMIYDRFEKIRAMITAVAPSNEHYYYFQEKFNLPLDPQDYEQEQNGPTWLYKITWKCRYKETLPDGNETYYARWKREFGA